MTIAGDQQQAQPNEELDDAQAQADFDAGAQEESSRPLTAKEETDEAKPAKEEPQAQQQEVSAAEIRKPKYVRLTSEDYERLTGSAKKTEAYEQQFSKVFGTIGDLQKIIKGLQTQTPRGTPVELPKDALAGMEKDFPELAAHLKTALEATLKGVTGTGSASAEVNTEEFDRRVEQRLMKLQVEALEDAYPDWRTIVGHVDTTKGETPDPNNAFRKWLSTKDTAYQAKINGTNSAEVIARAIRAFQKDTVKAPSAAPGNPRAAARADLIRENIRPRGDGGHPKGPNAEDEFEAGFKTG